MLESIWRNFFVLKLFLAKSGGRQRLKSFAPSKGWMATLLFFFLTINLYGFEKELTMFSREFLKNNFSIARERQTAILSALNYKAKLLEKRWSISGFTSKQQDHLERNTNTSFFPKEDRSIYGISIKKDFSLGNSLTFSNEFLQTTSSRETYYGPTQSLSYTQDLGSNFLGRKYLGELKQAKLDLEYARAFRDENIQNELRLFIEEYMALRLAKTLFILEEEALMRAKKRLSFVKEKVGNGLRERVDLYQSQMALLLREEQVRSLGVNIFSKLKHLSKKIGRDVREEELLPLPIKKEDTIPLPVGTIENNLSLRELEAHKKREKNLLQRTRYNLWPKIKLSFEYKTNEYDSSPSKAFSRTQIILGPQNDFFETSLRLDMPFSFQKEDLELQKAKNQFRISSEHYSFRKRELKNSEQDLLHQIADIEKRLSSAKERLDLAHRALREYNALYRLGRVGLDQVIRAEEELINTQKGLADYFSSKRNIYLNLAFSYGILREYFKI